MSFCLFAVVVYEVRQFNILWDVLFLCCTIYVIHESNQDGCMSSTLLRSH